MPKVSKTNKEVVINSNNSFWEYIKGSWNGDAFGKVIAILLFPFFTFYLLCKIIWEMSKGINSVSKNVKSPFSKKCPKCNSTNLNYVKPSSFTKASDAYRFFFSKPTATLVVCRDCGFSWEDR